MLANSYILGPKFEAFCVPKIDEKSTLGPSRAKMILMAGQKITAQEAQVWGLIDKIVEPEELMATVDELTADVLAAKIDHVQGIKQLI